jgi:hypothetical protein
LHHFCCWKERSFGSNFFQALDITQSSKIYLYSLQPITLQHLIMAEYYRLDAGQALSLMQKGDLTVEEYAKSLLSRIKERDHVVKAWAYLDPDFVLKQARALDQIPAEKRGPLHGVAVGVKDVILTKGNFPRFYVLDIRLIIYQICQHNITPRYTRAVSLAQ